MGTKVPAKVLIRGRFISKAVYGFGDASGEGFGATWVENKGGPQKVKFRMRVWKEIMNDKSSNFRELENLVEKFSLFFVKQTLVLQTF